MSRAHTEDGMLHAFFGVSTDTWVKIVLGWLVAMLVGTGGWFLHVRDGLSDRPTDKTVELKIEAATAAAKSELRETAALLSERMSDQREVIQAHAANIKAVELAAAAFVQAQKSQERQLAAIDDDLDALQSDITKLLRRGN